MQLSTQSIEQIDQSPGFGFDDGFHNQLAGRIANRNGSRFLVNIQADILDIATQHTEYLLGGRVILQRDHFSPRLSVILVEATATMKLSSTRSKICLGLSGG
jgi:hypothetical protein